MVFDAFLLGGSLALPKNLIKSTGPKLAGVDGNTMLTHLAVDLVHRMSKLKGSLKSHRRLADVNQCGGHALFEEAESLET